MTTTATVKQVVSSPKERAIKAELTMLSSGVAVRDAGALPAKFLAIMDYYYRHIDPKSGVCLIVPRTDGRPSGACGLSHALEFAYSLNLDQIFKKALNKTRTAKSFMDIRTTAWYGLLITAIHESIHVAEAFQDPTVLENPLEGEEEVEMEKLVSEAARDKLEEIAKQIDIEPPAVADMGWMSVLMQHVFIADAEDEAVKKTQLMIEKGLVYMDDTEEDKTIFHKTLREYIRATSNPEDPAWEGTPAVVNMTYELENGETGTATSDAVDEAPAVEVKEEETAAAIPGVIAVNEAGQAVINSQAPAQAAMFGATAAAVPTTEVLSEADYNPENEIIAELFDGDSDEVVAETTALVSNAQPAATAPVHATASDVAGGHTAAAGNMGFPVPDQVAQNIAAAQPATPNLGQPPYAGQPTPSLPPEQLKACLYEIYGRLFHAMFTKCGWSKNPQTGRFHFAEPGKALASISIDDILKRYNAEGLVAEYESIDPNTNQKVVEKCSLGSVRGTAFSDSAGGWLPVYALHLNINGNRIIRKLIPQNPMKRDANNAYKKSADEAAAGYAKVYVFSDAPQTATWPQRCPLKMFYDYGSNSIRYEEQR